MLGFRIYFDGNKFVADNNATEVQTTLDDSVVMWFTNRKSADNAVRKHNADDIKDVKNAKNAESISGKPMKKEIGMLIEI